MAVIAIDGPAGSGKSTTAKLVAKELGFIYVDTGAMYRAVALESINRKANLSDASEIAEIATQLKIHFKEKEDGQHIFLDDKDVSEEIRRNEVSEAASIIATYTGVRKHLVKIQQDIGRHNNVVMEGRDIGTVVFPEAEVKIFMIATYPTRAERRQSDLVKKGEEIKIPALVNQLKERDLRDSSREDSPLMKTEESIVIDTTLLTIEEQVSKVVNIAREKLNLK
ncbi:MAG: (d)CMP kinase [Candidatus Coatesbacteria bacterium]|nr:(d)CMP kinase [Candidatus Coatesbacteria bacterium]